MCKARFCIDFVLWLSTRSKIVYTRRDVNQHDRVVPHSPPTATCQWWASWWGRERYVSASPCKSRGTWRRRLHIARHSIPPTAGSGQVPTASDPSLYSAASDLAICHVHKRLIGGDHGVSCCPDTQGLIKVVSRNGRTPQDLTKLSLIPI